LRVSTQLSDYSSHMTVVATVITRHFTAHASDSFLTVVRPNQMLEVVNSSATKLVRVPAWRGVIAYWGLSRRGDDWDTLAWLRRAAASAHEHASAAEFAGHLATSLTRALRERRFARPIDRGLGLHFTFYEHVGGYWVPELFLITNWTDASYAAVRGEGFRATRETYGTLRGVVDRPEDHASTAHRLEVHRALVEQPLMFRFVNGDPTLFNPSATAVLDTLVNLSLRGDLFNPESARTHLALVRRPVELASRLVSDFVAPGRRRVGGRTHDLAVSPGGDYDTTTGG
jgi:hypothetical protein